MVSNSIYINCNMKCPDTSAEFFDLPAEIYFFCRRRKITYMGPWK